MAAASTRLTPRSRQLPPTVGGPQRTVDTPMSRSVRHRRARFRRPRIPEQQPTRRSPPVPATEARAARSPVRDAADLQSVLLQPLTHDTPRRHLDARGVAQPLDPLAVRRCAGGRSNEIHHHHSPARPDDTRTPSRLQRAGVVQMVQREPGEDEGERGFGER
jgi:hypothetical protein